MFCISTVLPVRGGATISARWPLPIGATISITLAERSFLVGSSSSSRNRWSGNSGVRLSKLTLCFDFSGSSKRSEEHTSELQSHSDLVCRLLLEKKKKKK